MKKLPLALALTLAVILIGQGLLSVRRSLDKPATNKNRPSQSVAVSQETQSGKTEALASLASGQPKPLVVKRGKQAIKPEEVIEAEAPKGALEFSDRRETRRSRSGEYEDYEEGGKQKRQKGRYTLVGRLPKYAGQDGLTTSRPMDTKPAERQLTRAGKSFTGDLRNLSKSRPVRRERPEREGPEPKPTMIQRGTPAPTPVPSVRIPTRLPNLALAPAPLMDFDGLDREGWGSGSPSDVNGDVGPTYYIQSVNSSVGIFRKSDGFREAAFTFDTLMSQGSFGNLCDNSNFGDPVVLYDTFEDRWILTDFAFQLDGSGNVNPPVAYQCFAVSRTSNPVSGGWNFYSIEVTDGLNDYPKLGIWPDGLYMSANMFGYAAGASFQGARAWALNKAQMYAGSPTVQVVSFDLGTGDFTVVPSNARLQTGTPPAGTPNYFVSTWNFLNAVSVYKFHVDWHNLANSTFTGPDSPLAATSWPNASVANAQQTGTTTLLDVLQIRAMVQNQYSNIGGVESLWATHTVRRGNTTGFAAPRWYQVNVTGGTVAANIPQAATWDPDGANVLHRFMPSLAVDRQGNMALGYSTSSSTTVPAIKYAGRLASDPVNTFSQTEQTLFAGEASQTGSSRWGDYSSMTLDIDGCTFWYTNQYGNTDQSFDKRWKTRINSFRLPGCTDVGAGGTLAGTVTATAGGAPIAGVTVALGARSTTTDGLGQYSFTGLPAGTYPVISATLAGYVTASATSIVVTDGGTTTQDFALTTAPTNACPADTTQADFQTGVGTNVDLNTSPGDVTLLNASIIDQQNTAGTTTGTGFGTPAWTGQTFTAAITGQLVKADVQLFCNGCGATPPNLTLSVRATSGGLPTGADLATATIPGSTFANGSTVTYTASFGSPPAVTSGTKYALILRPVSAAGGSGYFWIRSSPSTYANGSRVLSADSGAAWTADTTRDYNFKTYIQTGYSTSGNLVSGTKDANPAAGLVTVWGTLTWTAATPANTGLQFQVAASNNANGPFTFVGPDNTSGTFFTTSGASLNQFNGLRYLQYKAYLSTTDNTMTPTLNDVTLCYLNGGTATVAGGGTICANGSTNVTVTVNGGTPPYTVILSNGGGTQTGAGPIFTFPVSPTSDTTYTLAAGSQDTNSVPLIGSGSATVTVTPLPPTPTIMASGPTTFCDGGSVTLNSSSATGNQWYLNGNPLGGATGQMYVASAAGNYTVIVTANGCSSAPSMATAVTVTPLPPTPTITPGGPTTFCDGGSVTLTSNSVTGNQWYLNGNPLGGATNQSYSATATGNYTVRVTANGCASMPSAPTAVTVNPTPPTPTISAGGATTFCPGGSVTLTSSSATGNQWYLNGNPLGGATGQQYMASAMGNYTVVVTASNCPSAASAPTVVTVNPTPPMPTVTVGGPTTFCAGGSVTLTSSSATGNQWYLNGNPLGGATGQQYMASATGNYTVVVTANGCASVPSAPTAVTVNPTPPTPTITPSGPTTFCAGGSVTLNSSSATGNQWYLNGNPLGGATGQSYLATAAGNYTVIVTTNGCASPASAPTMVMVNPIPATPTITPGGPTTFCPTGNVTLNSSSVSGNQWYLNGNLLPGATGQSYLATVAGSYTVITTANGCNSAASAPTVVAVSPITISPASLPGGTVGVLYNQPISATPANSYTFTVTGGALPGGLQLNNSTGVLMGTPTNNGTFNFTLTATSSTCSGSRNYTMTIGCGSLTLSPGSLPNVEAGIAYNQAVSAAGATSYSLLIGNLPPGLGLNNSTGAITGTTTATGTYSFTIQATVASGCSTSQAYTVVVTCPTIVLNPTNGTLPGGTVGTAYSQTLSATPGGNYSFTKTSGTLPPGFTLNNTTGVLSGNPTTQGSYTFTVTATGFGACTSSRSYTVAIGASCATITLPSLPATGKIGTTYYGNLAATTPSASYTFSLDSGTLPPGLTIDNLFGALTGKPTAAGTYTFTLKATRSNGCTGTKTYTVVISSPLAALAQVSDYDGDGKSDLSLWSAGTGAWRILVSTTQEAQQQSWGGAGDVTLLGDYDGDGKSDLAIFRPSEATFYIRRSSNGGALVKQLGASTDVPVVGDYDGDGKTDIAVWRGSNGGWLITRSSDGRSEVVSWGTSSSPYLDVPVPADYDGDGKTDIAVFRRQTGTWLIKRSRDGQTLMQTWGAGTDVPVVGDYDGDGKADIAVWRGATGQWLALRSSNQSYDVITWGAASAGDVPVAGDYDGDGRSDLAVWRSASSTWYIKCTVADTIIIREQGPATALPVAGRQR